MTFLFSSSVYSGINTDHLKQSNLITLIELALIIMTLLLNKIRHINYSNTFILICGYCKSQNRIYKKAGLLRNLQINTICNITFIGN